MREKLKAMGVNSRHVFYGTFMAYGLGKTQSGETQKTLLFQKIKDENGDEVADHIWMWDARSFNYFEFRNGDVIKFEATIKKYWKGYRGKRDDGEKSVRTKDYELVHPSNVRLIWRGLSKTLLSCYEELY